MTNVEFHLQLNHNVTWNMSRLHFHDHYELLLPLTSPGNIFVNDQVYPLQRGTLYLIGENTLHRTIATGFHARYILHIGRKALAELSTPQTDLTQLTHDSFRRAALSTDEMTEIIELFQALERNKNDGSFGSDIHQMTALLNLLVYVAPALNAATERFLARFERMEALARERGLDFVSLSLDDKDDLWNEAKAVEKPDTKPEQE